MGARLKLDPYLWDHATSTAPQLAEYDGSAWWAYSYSEVVDDARRVAASLGGLRTGSTPRILVVLPSGRRFGAAFYGTWLRGGTPVPLPPPSAFSKPTEYRGHVARSCTAVDADAAICAESHCALLREALDVPVFAVEDLIEAAPADELAPVPDVAVVQLTSGSTAAPKAVRITRAVLEAHVETVSSWLGYDRRTSSTTWLPMFHDMGLVGFVCASTIGSPARILQPETFVRNPLAWLICHGRDGATLSSTPPFGLDHVVRRVKPHQLEGFDFSQWTALVVGSERIAPEKLRRFAALLGPFGFDPAAFLPAYGLAEATLAVTGHRRVGRLRVAALGASGRARPVVTEIDFASNDADEHAATSTGHIVGSGCAVPGMGFRVVDGEGEEVPDGVFGAILVRGRSLADGYEAGGRELVQQFGDEFDTGDIGFTDAEELFVLGRAGDSIRVRGQSVFADDIDARLATVSGLPARRACVLLGETSTGASAVVVVERALDDDVREAVARTVRQVVGQAVSVRIVNAGPGGILRTTSGKPRRRVLWGLQRDGVLERRAPVSKGDGS